jgi:hypothetical protein
MAESILTKIKEDEVLSEKMTEYYQKELFVGCPSNPEFDAQIETERLNLEEKLTTFADKKEEYNELLSLIANIPADKQESFLIQINSNKNLPVTGFKAALKIASKNDDDEQLLDNEALDQLVTSKGKIVSLISLFISLVIFQKL